MIAELTGGPLDGLRLRLTCRFSFVWVTTEPGKNGRHHAHLMAGPGRLLYRARGVHYVHADRAWGVCDGCGAFVDRVGGHVTSCSLCGGALAPQPSAS